MRRRLRQLFFNSSAEMFRYYDQDPFLIWVFVFTSVSFHPSLPAMTFQESFAVVLPLRSFKRLRSTSVQGRGEVIGDREREGRRSAGSFSVPGLAGRRCRRVGSGGERSGDLDGMAMVEGIGRSEANWAGDWPVASLKIVLSSS